MAVPAVQVGSTSRLSTLEVHISHRMAVARQRGFEVVQKLHAAPRRTTLTVVLLVTLSACLSEQEAITGNSGGGSSNSPPSLSGIPANTVKIGESYSFQPDASDPDGDALSFGIQNKPAWANFDTTNAQFSGVPLLGDEGVYSDITISVSDGSDTSSLAFSVTVTSIGSASVTLSWTPPTENEDGSALTDLAGYNIYYGDSAGTYPNWIRIDNSGMSTYVVGNLTPKTYYFVATSFNAMGIESRYSNEAVKVAN